MFNYFHLNKFRYDKGGQFTPIMIVILVILTTMAMVTVNLSKVALTKTNTSNAVDAGGLAAGSAMANLFNSICASNGRMEGYYWSFFIKSIISVGLTIERLIAAEGYAATALTAAGLASTSATTFVQVNAQAARAIGCPPGAAICGAIPLIMNANQGLVATVLPQITAAITATDKAIKAVQSARTKIRALIVQLIGFHLAQMFLYLIIRKNAATGRENAIKMGHVYAFMNSAVAGKLKPDAAPAEITDPLMRKNYQDAYRDFTKDIEHDEEYTYAWKDGQQRAHSVNSKVKINPVDTFDMQVTLLPFPANLAILLAAHAAADSSIGLLTAAKTAFETARTQYTTANTKFLAALPEYQAACGMAWCCPDGEANCCAAQAAVCWRAQGFTTAGLTALTAGITANGTGITSTTEGVAALQPIYFELGAYIIGITPALTVRLDHCCPFMSYCWIDDIWHDRLVKVDSIQAHAGADLGLWSTNYPITKSNSTTNFEGHGVIHPPDPRFDASIVDTDKYSGPHYSTCHYLQDQVQALRENARNLISGAEQAETSAAGMEEEALAMETLGGPANIEAALALRDIARQVRIEATANRDEASTLEQQAQDIINQNPDCAFPPS